MNCPNCGQPVTWQDNPTRPFCSERCKLIDFGKWANEEFRVPDETTQPVHEAEDEAEHPASDMRGESQSSG